MRFGFQTYGMSKYIEENPKEFFCKAVQCGFRMMELCLWLFPGKSPMEALWSAEKFAQMAEMAAAEGISICGVHVFTDRIAQQKGELEKLNKKYGICNFVVKLKEPFEKQNLLSQAADLTEAADAVASFGGKILLHNEKQEIQSKIDGISAYEWVLSHTDGKVFAEADTGWLFAGGEDPESFLWRNKEKILAVHFKDFELAENGEKEVTIGRGVTDITAYFQFVRAMEIHGIIDMDEPQEGDLAEAGKILDQLTSCRENTRSILNVYDVESGKITPIASYDGIVEAPNWLLDGDTILYNADGYIWKHSIKNHTDEKIDSENCDNCNNDHVPSPDNTKVAVSHSPKGTWESRIYILPLAGGEPKLIVEKQPSYLHGWSPDGKELSYCAFREDENGKMGIDIYVKEIAGGEERALTCHQGMNDGPEYQADGKKIWFISTRSGLMQVYRMNPDGTDQEQMTFEKQNNWFGHISPDGKQVVNIAYSEWGLDATEHLPNMYVSLWLMNSDGSGRRKIVDLFGGQGSINVNSWSPDSRKFAFVSYELMHK